MDKKPRLVFNGSTDKCVKFFKNHHKDFSRVVKLTSFFDNANFLFTPYQVDNNNIHLILENERGEEMQFSGLNCGYNGTGPNGTGQIMEQLGVPEHEILSWIRHTALVVDFSEDIPVMKQTPIFFGNPSMANTASLFLPCKLDEYTFVNPYDRVVYMLEPSLRNISGYYNCLEAMNPVKVVYSTGKQDAPMNIAASIDDLYFHLRQTKDWRNKERLHVNLVIYGERFNIIACLSAEEILPIIYSTHYALLHNPIQDMELYDACQSPLMDSGKKSVMHVLKTLFRTYGTKEYIGSFEIPNDGKRGEGIFC